MNFKIIYILVFLLSWSLFAFSDNIQKNKTAIQIHNHDSVKVVSVSANGRVDYLINFSYYQLTHVKYYFGGYLDFDSIYLYNIKFAVGNIKQKIMDTIIEVNNMYVSRLYIITFGISKYLLLEFDDSSINRNKDDNGYWYKFFEFNKNCGELAEIIMNENFFDRKFLSTLNDYNNDNYLDFILNENNEKYSIIGTKCTKVSKFNRNSVGLKLFFCNFKCCFRDIIKSKVSFPDSYIRPIDDFY